MRRNLVNEVAGNLKYEIREIVAVANQIGDLGVEITWDNIGDPILKGDSAPTWLRETVAEIAMDPTSWAYSETAGVRSTREFLAEQVNSRGGVQIGPDDINFYNGLGDAVAKVYSMLRREARVLGPSPVYSPHSSAESAGSGYSHCTYRMDPYNGWLPDMDEVRQTVKYNDSIAGILVLAPGNPTGTVFPREMLYEFAEIADEYDLFIVKDEIYTNIVYDGNEPFQCCEWIGDVPGISMKGISKEYPWPGGRCGWMEFLNKDKDSNFAAYADSLLAAKRLEVSSTTLPQLSIPPVMSDPRYAEHLVQRQQQYEQRSIEMHDCFKDIDGIICNKPSGAFYYTVMFKENQLTDQQTLPIENPEVKKLIEKIVADVPPDKRFVYYLMGATGIVVVPLSGFHCDYPGFRGTLLEHDDEKRRWIYKTVGEAIKQYLAS